MRFLGIIIALVIIGFLVQRQLAGPSATTPPETTATGVQPPSVPQTVQDVPKFESDMNAYMKDLDNQSRQKIEQNTQ